MEYESLDRETKQQQPPVRLVVVDEDGASESVGDSDDSDGEEQMDIIIRDADGHLLIEDCLMATDEVLQEAFQQLSDVDGAIGELFHKMDKWSNRIRALEAKVAAATNGGEKQEATTAKVSTKKRKPPKKKVKLTDA